MPAPQSDRAFFDRWFGEVWNKGNYDVAYEVIDPDFTVHGAGGQDIKSGPDGVIGLVKTWRAAFPDGQMLIQDGIFEGEYAALRTTWIGTQSGEFYGIPASGKRVACTSIGFDRVQNGKVTEGWGELDMLGMMQQLGVMPGLDGASPAYEWGADAAAAADGNDPDQSKSVLRRFVDAVGGADIAVVRSVVTAQYVDHNPTTGVAGVDGTLDCYRQLRQAIPDLSFAVDDAHVIAQGDRAFCRWTATGTHTGAPLWGTAAAGKAVTFTGSDLVRVDGGKVAERWISADILTLVKQIGPS